MEKYKESILWQKSNKIFEIVDKMTTSFPNGGDPDEILKIRKLAESVPVEIAEGYSRESLEECLTYLYMAYTLNCEFGTQILKAKEKEILDEVVAEFLIEEISSIGSLLESTILELEKKVHSSQFTVNG